MKTKTMIDYCDDAISDAEKFIGGPMESSARLCLSDAVDQYKAGNYHDALRHAARSLKYSVGIGALAWQRANDSVKTWAPLW